VQKSIHAALIATAVVAIPMGSAVAWHTPSPSGVAEAAAKSTATATKTPVAKSKPAPIVARRYVGPSVDMQWGPVQVTIVVKGNTVTDLSATAPNHRARSAFINNQAVPMLRQEVLQAKTAAHIKNIYGISGATMTSEAFYQSLLSALHTAHLA
jgi:uncharacterized protein with FMN-binding domain